MKTLVLKENQVLYDVTIDASLRTGEEILLERAGRPIAVLVPYDDYMIYRAWLQQRREAKIAANWPEDRTLEEVVADIKRRGPGIPRVHEATASLADLLENAPHDPDFNLEEWTREWEKINAEIEANDPHPL